MDVFGCYGCICLTKRGKYDKSKINQTTEENNGEKVV